MNRKRAPCIVSFRKWCTASPTNAGCPLSACCGQTVKAPLPRPKAISCRRVASIVQLPASDSLTSLSHTVSLSQFLSGVIGFTRLGRRHQNVMVCVRPAHSPEVSGMWLCYVRQRPKRLDEHQCSLLDCIAWSMRLRLGTWYPTSHFVMLTARTVARRFRLFSRIVGCPFIRCCRRFGRPQYEDGKREVRRLQASIIKLWISSVLATHANSCDRWSRYHNPTQHQMYPSSSLSFWLMLSRPNV